FAGGQVKSVAYGQWVITDPSGEYTLYTPIPQPFPRDAKLPTTLRVNNLLQSAFSVSLSAPLQDGQKAPAALIAAFAANGITLSNGATVSQVSGPAWVVTDPLAAGSLDQGEIYPLQGTTAASGTSKYGVFMPLTASWCDSNYAVYPFNNYGAPQLI